MGHDLTFFFFLRGGGALMQCLAFVSSCVDVLQPNAIKYSGFRGLSASNLLLISLILYLNTV